jgi:hypothetical protein
MKAYRQSFLGVALLLACSSAATSLYAQTRDINVTSADQVWEGAVPGARAGVWLDLGPLSAGDTRRDLVVGAPGGPGVLGTVHVIYGGPVRQGTVNLSTSDALITGEVAGDLFGTSTAVGNVLNTEGSDQRALVVGAPSASGGRGAVYLFAGAFGSLASLSAGSAVFKVIGAPGDQLGAMLATADLDNDGFREIVMGAPGTQRVYVIKGSASLSGIRDLNVTPASLTINLPGVGSVLAGGDVDGDNIQDLLVGAPTHNAIHIYTGKNGSLPTTASAVLAGLDSGDSTGASIRLADMDADGRRDILIGAPGGDGPTNARTDAGEVYLIWGGVPQVSRNMLSADVTFYGLPGERLGAQLTIGDINRDIPNDAVMLSEAAAGGNGILYIYYGRPRNEFGTALSDGRRLVDFTVADNVSRRIGSDVLLGPIRSAQVFEVTGEGARDIIVGIPGINSNTGRVYFTLSPKLTTSQPSVQIYARRETTGTASLGVLNGAALDITFTASTTAPWLTLSPASGSAVAGSPGTIGLTANAAGLAPGTYTTSITIESTSPDLQMAIPVTVTLTVTDTVVHLDGPIDQSTVSQPFNIGGWALDLSSTTSVGVDAIHIWAFPVSGATPIFLGIGNTGNPRPDVGAAYGHQFDNSGFNLQVTGIPADTYYIAVYAHNSTSGTFDATQVVTVTVVSSARMSVDTPETGGIVGSNFIVAGWAIDAAAPTGTGVDALHVWAFPTNGSAAVFLGVANYGASRPDVGAVFGSRFTPSGFNLQVTNLAPGTYDIVVYAHSTVGGKFDNSSGFLITVQQSARMSLDAPANSTTVDKPFRVGGWAIDLAAPSGTGVDTVHVWAQPVGGGSAIFLGQAVYGAARNDVGAAYGSQFTNSAFDLDVSSLAAGTYTISVYARSTVANAFNNIATSTVTVR